MLSYIIVQYIFPSTPLACSSSEWPSGQLLYVLSRTRTGQAAEVFGAAGTEKHNPGKSTPYVCTLCSVPYCTVQYGTLHPRGRAARASLLLLASRHAEKKLGSSDS